MIRPARITHQIATRSAATLIAALLVAALFGNALVWVGRMVAS